MLKKLTIQNFAIIDHLVFEPRGAMNILTGETGAGKSILIGALGLLLGERAKLEQEDKCIIEAEFDLTKLNLLELFEENDLDFEPITFIRREITSTGRSRAFVNDTPTNLNVLKEIGEQLVDIHSQHQSLQVGNKEFQYKVVDMLAGTAGLYGEFAATYSSWVKAKNDLEKLRDKQAELSRDREFKQFQLDELLEANLTENEDQELEDESELLENAEELIQKASQGFDLLDGGEMSVSQIIAQYISELKSIQGGGQLESIKERLNSLLIESRELASDLTDFGDSVSLDPERLEEVNNRLDQLNALKNKHRVTSLSELIQLREDLDSALLSASDLDYEISEKVELVQSLHQKGVSLGEKLYQERINAIGTIEDRMNADMLLLGMPNARFSVRLEKDQELNQRGMDKLEWYFSANKGKQVQPIAKVASGGELSRIMLILKSYIAEHSVLPTLIFDEIDTGVSGEIARKMGEMMKSLSKGHQLVTITHLPQIAAKGDTHFYVYKEEVAGETKTKIRSLDGEERVEEIARMLSGENPTDGALTNAKELIRD